MKPSQKHQRDAELMTAFSKAYVDLIANSEPFDGNWGVELGPKVIDDVWEQKLRAVAAAAGAVGESYSRHGGLWTLRRPGLAHDYVDPVANWESSLSDPETYPAQRMITSVDAAIASAQRAATDAAKRERGLTGLIAAFLRWPSDLREAVGPGHGAQRRAAGAIGVVGQILVAGLAGALATGIGAGTIALVGLVF